MNKTKYSIILICLLTLILSISCISATDLNDNQPETDDNIQINDDSNQSVDTDNNEISDTNTAESRNYEITDDNYNDYFDIEYGEFLENSTIKDGDVLKIGNVTDKRFVITKSLNITSISKDDVITNGMIYLIGTENTNITGLTFRNNGSSYYNGTVDYTNNNNHLPLIPIVAIDCNNLHVYSNNIKSTNNNAIGIQNVTNSKIENNDFSTYTENAGMFGGKSVFIIHGSENNTISDNNLTSNKANCISFATLGKYTDKSLNKLISSNNIIENNILDASTGNSRNAASAWIIKMQNQGHNIIKNNKILNGNTGINAQSQKNGSLICNNEIINCYSGIYIVDINTNSTVFNNTIDVNMTGITAQGNITIENNRIISNNTGLSISNNNTKILNNIIIVNNSTNGKAIDISGNNAIIDNNTINSTYEGIIIKSNNLNVINNNINANKTAISIVGSGNARKKVMSNNITINNNNITVYNNENENITGIYTDYANNTEITNNNIKTNGEYAIKSNNSLIIKNNSLISNSHYANEAVNFTNENVTDNTPVAVVLDYDSYNKKNIIITAKDSENNPASNLKLTVIVNGTELPEKLVTDEEGNAIIKDIYGKYTLTVVSEGNNQYIENNNSIDNVLVINNNEKINTTIVSHDFSQTAVDFYNGERGGLFVVALRDANGNPLVGKNVKIGFNGAVYNRTTNDTGYVNLTINLRTAGDYTFATAFLGDDDYAGSFVVNTIHISKKVSRIVLSGNSPVKVNAYRTLTISLQGQRALNHNSYITAANKTVKVTVNGRTYSVRIGPNKKGTLRIRFTRAGTYTITTKFAGDGTYSAKTLTSKITVRK